VLLLKIQNGFGNADAFDVCLKRIPFVLLAWDRDMLFFFVCV
jgi:hypothetical protein